MEIEALTQHQILSSEAINELKKLRIRTVEALLARAQDQTARDRLAVQMKVRAETFPDLLHRAQCLVPEFDPSAEGPPVARGAIKPPNR
ncbi:MAG: hypothetical protein U0931_36625 [Vulcanimicrobiota bacterium]